MMYEYWSEDKVESMLGRRLTPSHTQAVIVNEAMETGLFAGTILGQYELSRNAGDSHWLVRDMRYPFGRANELKW